MTDVESARNMLSTLIQSEASIFGLVITLSLIAVQQSASSYSPKIIGIFRDPRINLDFYILSFVFISLIIYEIWLLKEVKIDSLSYVNESFERNIQISFSLTIFAFLSLILYTLNILELLRPTKVIQIISQNILRKNISLFIINRHRLPIQPIADIIKASLSRYDYETSIFGIKTISDISLPILKENSISENDLTKIIENFFNDIEGIFKIALIQKDQETVLEIIGIYKNIGEIATKKKYNNTTIQVLLSIDNVIDILSDYNMKFELKKILNILDEVEGEAISKNMDLQVLEKIISSLNLVKNCAIKYNHTEILYTLIICLSKIEKIILERNKKRPNIKVILLLRDILKYSITKNIKSLTQKVENTFVDLIRESAERNNQNFINEVIQVQKEILEIILERRNDNLMKIQKSAFGDMKKIAINHKMQSIINEIDNLVARYPP